MHESTSVTDTTAAAALRRGAFRPAALERAGPASGISVELIHHEQGFAALEDEWRALEARAPACEYFACFDWVWCWWRHFGAPSGAAPLLIAARRAGTLVALMPLAVDRAGPYRYATLMGNGTGQYGDILADPAPADPAPADRTELFAALWSGLKGARVDAVHFDTVRDDSVLAAFLAPRRKCVGQEQSSYEVDTSAFADFDAYTASRAARQRKDLRRRRRRLAEAGSPVYTVVTDPCAIGETAIRAIELKREWLAERGLHGRFLARANVGAWLADVAGRAHARGRLHLSVLRVGPTLAAAQLAFRCGRRLVAYFGAFNVAYSRHSVGRLHLEDHVAEVFEAGWTLDLLPPGDDYKLEWASPGAIARSYTVPVSLVGRAAAIVHNPRQRERLKAAYLAIPGTGRARIAAALLGLARLFKRALSGARRPIPPAAEDQQP